MSYEVTFRLNQAELDRLARSDEGEVAVALSAIGARVERRAKRLCPVDTGRLRSSVTHATFRANGELEEHVGTAVEYATYVELGTARAAAQPFLRPALYAEVTS